MAITLNWLTVPPSAAPGSGRAAPGGADRRGRRRIEPAMDEHPGGRAGRRKQGGLAFPEPRPGEAPRRLGGQRLKTIGRTSPDRNGNRVKDFLPRLPAIDLEQV